MKHIFKLFVSFIAIIWWFFVVVSWENCNSYSYQTDQYYACIQNNTWVYGPIFQGNWDWGDSFFVWVYFIKHGPGYLWDLNQTIHCDSISVVWWNASITDVWLDQCNVSISNITQNSVTINVPSWVCFLWSYSNSAWSQTYTRPWGSSEVTIWAPTIGNWTWDGNTVENIEVSFHIEWYDSSMNVEIDNSKFHVEWWPIFGTDPHWQLDWDHWIVDYTFSILNIEDSAELVIDAWAIKVWNKESSAWNKTFTKPESDTWSCDYPIESGGDCQDVYWWYFSLGSEPNCCVQGGCQRTPDASWFCEDWYANDWNGCCSLISLLCSWNLYAPDWWNCVPCEEEGTIPNSDHTKCICDSSVKCCGVQLNMELPFIGDCIEMNTDSSNPDTTSVSSVTAFPILMQWLMKIVMSVILIFSFLMIIVAGLMMTAWAFKSSSFDKWKNILKNVIISLILLWCSWLILSLINPSFFGG